MLQEALKQIEVMKSSEHAKALTTPAQGKPSASKGSEQQKRPATMATITPPAKQARVNNSPTLGDTARRSPALGGTPTPQGSLDASPPYTPQPQTKPAEEKQSAPKTSKPNSSADEDRACMRALTPTNVFFNSRTCAGHLRGRGAGTAQEDLREETLRPHSRATVAAPEVAKPEPKGQPR